MMKILRKAISCVASIFIIVVILGTLVLWQTYRFWLQKPASDAQYITFTIKEAARFGEAAYDLKQQDLIASPFWFRVFGKIDGTQRKIQAGSFELQSGMNYSSIVDILTNANTEEVSITIPEGYTLDQIGEVVMANFNVSESEWGVLTGMESTFESHEFVIWAQKPANVDLEGYLFPDTYRFFEDATGEEIVEKMIDTMQIRVNTADTTLPKDWTGHEWLTLASIIEREVRGAQDKAIVADLFMRRLEIGMALQADSTVNYVTGKKTPGISLADRDIDSPYNTYQNPGLPPGPISNPGLESLIAVAHPTPNSFFYFLTTEIGDVKYAISHNDHVRNKKLYLP